MTATTKKILCHLLLLPTEFGGRSGPISSGYQGAIVFHSNATTAIVTTPNESDMYPGQTADVTIDVKNTQLQPELSHGMQFHLIEGPRVIGVGVILNVIIY